MEGNRLKKINCDLRIYKIDIDRSKLLWYLVPGTWYTTPGQVARLDWILVLVLVLVLNSSTGTGYGIAILARLDLVPQYIFI